MNDDIVERLLDAAGEMFPGSFLAYEGPVMKEAAEEIERLRKRDAVLELFRKAFHVDDYGQFVLTNGEDIFAAVRAYAQMRVEEARRG